MVSEASSTPKLSLFSLPRQPPERPEMPTPPIHTLASIPFQWEEAPGKPRPTTTTTPPPSKSKAARCLDLPPRLLSERVKITKMPSPTTVLDGPYVGRSVSRTLSFSLPKGSFWSTEEGGVGGVRCRKRDIKESESFGSWRWGGFKENGGAIGGNFDFSYPVGSGGSESDAKAKITRVRRRSSFLIFSNSTSNLWGSIYGSFKQAVPWRRRQDKLRKI